MAEPTITVPESYRPALNAIGVRITILADGDTKLTLQAGDEGAGPPPHSHPWDECFFVTKGAVEFTTGGKSVTCRAGSLVQVPGGTPHAFRFAAGGGEMLEITGAQSRALAMFAQLDREVPPGPPDLAKAAAVLGQHDVTLHL